MDVDFSDGDDDAGGLVRFLQHAALFDVELDVAAAFGRGVADGSDLRRGALAGDGLLDGDPRGVFCCESFRVERGGDAAAAEVGGLETDAFIVGKCEQVDGVGEVGFLLPEGVQGGERGDDAEGAVVFPGTDDGVVAGTLTGVTRLGDLRREGRRGRCRRWLGWFPCRGDEQWGIAAAVGVGAGVGEELAVVDQADADLGGGISRLFQTSR
jgi:hypothetical protein